MVAIINHLLWLEAAVSDFTDGWTKMEKFYQTQNKADKKTKHENITQSLPNHFYFVHLPV